MIDVPEHTVVDDIVLQRKDKRRGASRGASRIRFAWYCEAGAGELAVPARFKPFPPGASFQRRPGFFGFSNDEESGAALRLPRRG